MNQIAKVEQGPSVIHAMAERYGMAPAPFEATLRATVVPEKCTREQFAAFLLVAKEYDLNPILKEIYAFPTKSGGIQPIVSIDGWMNLINSHPKMNGLEFDDHFDDKGNLDSITARIWRKDREHPVVVTEYMVECKRGTEPWKQWPRRMLRHKAAIQCARYAFGFAGIVDPDEADRMTDVGHVTDVTPPSPPPAPRADAGPQSEATVAHTEPESEAPVAEDDIVDAEVVDTMPECPGTDDPEKFLRWVDQVLSTVQPDQPDDALQNAWDAAIEPYLEGLFPPDQSEAQAIFDKHEKRLAP